MTSALMAMISPESADHDDYDDCDDLSGQRGRGPIEKKSTFERNGGVFFAGARGEEEGLQSGSGKLRRITLTARGNLRNLICRRGSVMTFNKVDLLLVDC